MSPDWAWLLVPAVVVPPALGHLYHFILIDQRRQRPGTSRADHGQGARPAVRGTGGLVGALALDAPAYAVVDLGVAALELCRALRGLGHA